MRAGRFLTRDPIGFIGGINLYEYVGNCPVMNREPVGEDFRKPNLKNVRKCWKNYNRCTRSCIVDGRIGNK
ncbi:RHS repeat domain-containing protein [Chthonomonas sp.]|uniref:RHS repeat domain-containing protein n=1 Tax=Chthonomonas sp. TaxID=2282153 RepID=UPI0039C8946D